jgi:hypothetical protein
MAQQYIGSPQMPVQIEVPNLFEAPASHFRLSSTWLRGKNAGKQWDRNVGEQWDIKHILPACLLLAYCLPGCDRLQPASCDKVHTRQSPQPVQHLQPHDTTRRLFTMATMAPVVPRERTSCSAGLCRPARVYSSPPPRGPASSP